MKIFRSTLGAFVLAMLTMGFMPVQTVTVNDASSYGAGVVILEGLSQASAWVNVPVPGSYATNVDFTPIDVVVNGHVIPYPSAANVTLANGYLVRVQWGSSNLVEILDPSTDY